MKTRTRDSALCHEKRELSVNTSAFFKQQVPFRTENSSSSSTSFAPFTNHPNYGVGWNQPPIQENDKEPQEGINKLVKQRILKYTEKSVEDWQESETENGIDWWARLQNLKLESKSSKFEYPDCLQPEEDESDGLIDYFKKLREEARNFEQNLERKHPLHVEGGNKAAEKRQRDWEKRKEREIGN